jgi:hypothetical protein
MPRKTCAACDCELDANAIKVTVGGKSVEVCCDDCAQKLNEAQEKLSEAQPAATKRG